MRKTDILGYRRSWPFAVCSLFFLLFLFSQPQAVQADEPAADSPTGLCERTTLLGAMGGFRTLLGKYGITFALSETSEVLGNSSGGVRRGADYEGATLMSLGLETDKSFGWRGGTFFVSALQLHGRGLSADNLDNLNTVSGIEAQRTTRLWELWFQQAFLGGKADVKIGQIGIDQEFLLSQCCSIYLNAMMGWPVLPAADLYAGGPAFPLSSPAVRLRVQPGDSLSLLAGVFDDNPPGGSFDDDAQLRDDEASGTRFNMTTGALFIGEVQYALNSPPGVSGCGYKGAAGLPGAYKLGAWFDTAKFPDRRFSASGLSLADPAGEQTPRMDRNNYSIYAIADQAVWREPGGPRMVSAFVRFMGAPHDRNLVDWSLNAGVNVTPLLPGRLNDVLGIGYGWAHVSGRAADLDRDTSFYSGAPYPVRGAEQFIEITCRFQIAPGWIIQPDLQYIIDPGGGVSDPLNPSGLVGNELVLGLRTIINF
ncbi:MAG: carbohydrate porin [Syntrophobacteraceae bacterium]|nr:carbohydrate porin [Syntrophobacteraceae bacterium]